MASLNPLGQTVRKGRLGLWTPEKLLSSERKPGLHFKGLSTDEIRPNLDYPRYGPCLSTDYEFNHIHRSPSYSISTWCIIGDDNITKLTQQNTFMVSKKYSSLKEIKVDYSVAILLDVTQSLLYNH